MPTYECKKICDGVWEMGYIPESHSVKISDDAAAQICTYDAVHTFFELKQMKDLAEYLSAFHPVQEASHINYHKGDGNTDDWHYGSYYELICIVGEDGTWIQYKSGVKTIIKQLKPYHAYLFTGAKINANTATFHRAAFNNKERILIRYTFGL